MSIVKFHGFLFIQLIGRQKRNLFKFPALTFFNFKSFSSYYYSLLFNFNLIHFSFFLLPLDFILLLLLQFLFNSNNYYIIFFKLIFFFLPRFHSISTIYYLFSLSPFSPFFLFSFRKMSFCSSMPRRALILLINGGPAG